MLGSDKTGNRSLTPFSKTGNRSLTPFLPFFADPFFDPFSEWVSAAAERRFLMPTLRSKNRAKTLAVSARER